MSLIVDFRKTPMSKVKVVQNQKGKEVSGWLTIYPCNALATFVNEPKGQLFAFWADEQHMKNCLKGANNKKVLSLKDVDTSFKEYKEWHLNLEYQESIVMIRNLVKLADVEIHTYREKIVTKEVKM